MVHKSTAAFDSAKSVLSTSTRNNPGTMEPGLNDRIEREITFKTRADGTSVLLLETSALLEKDQLLETDQLLAQDSQGRTLSASTRASALSVPAWKDGAF
jgi:hypothetical protein